MQPYYTFIQEHIASHTLLEYQRTSRGQTTDVVEGRSVEVTREVIPPAATAIHIGAVVARVVGGSAW